jgi:hypothetical protein
MQGENNKLVQTTGGQDNQGAPGFGAAVASHSTASGNKSRGWIRDGRIRFLDGLSHGVVALNSLGKYVAIT